MKEDSSGGASPCEGFCEGDLGGGLLYWGTQKMRFLRDMQMPCKWTSLFIGALLGNVVGVRLSGPWGKKTSISGFLSWIQRTLRFKSGGHLELC